MPAAGERQEGHRRAVRDLTVCGAGLVYLALVLFVNLDSPLLGLLWIAMAGYQLVEPHRRKGSRPPPGALH